MRNQASKRKFFEKQRRPTKKMAPSFDEANFRSVTIVQMATIILRRAGN
ncbi:hypothetical protein CAter282_1235 [Collimonas arenae]|uniref:Uncharacterized protein n=1 Tax=Collimonas arenae TaxID=279058 RepID=A0A127QG39_9BURK|nr:hypothetical protein CAter282_1235 [Collimonas arenae]